jgi:hypothetical protein
MSLNPPTITFQERDWSGETLAAMAAGWHARVVERLPIMPGAVAVVARSHPETYALLFSRLPEGSRIDPALNARASQAVVRTAGSLAGSDDALDAARTFVAWANGFIGMELAGAFRLGGDVDRAFEYGIDRIGAAVDMRGGG